MVGPESCVGFRSFIFGRVVKLCDLDVNCVPDTRTRHPGLGIPASSRYVDSCSPSFLAFHRWSFSSHQISGLQAWLVPLYPIKLAHPTVRIEVNIYFPSHIY